MNIIITRPLIDSEDLMGKLLSLGHKIIHVPTLKISKAELDPIDSDNFDITNSFSKKIFFPSSEK